MTNHDEDRDRRYEDPDVEPRVEEPGDSQELREASYEPETEDLTEEELEELNRTMDNPDEDVLYELEQPLTEDPFEDDPDPEAEEEEPSSSGLITLEKWEELPEVVRGAGEVGAPPILYQMRLWTGMGGGNSGIVGDSAHRAGFHRGARFVGSNDYSRRRDPNGSDGPYPSWNYACAGDFSHKNQSKLRAKHAALLTRLRRNDPSLSMICEMITKPWADKPVYYWARWNGVANIKRYTGSGHTHWSHVSWYRSRANKNAPLWSTSAAPVTPTPSPTPTPTPTPTTAPPWPYSPTFAFSASKYANKYNGNVLRWQSKMKSRGWTITPDGYYGPKSARVCRQFQQEKRLVDDALLGKQTWTATWRAPVT